MSEINTPPLWAHVEPGERFKVGEMAKILAVPGLTEQTLERQIRRFAQENWINFREERGTGPNAHRLYAPSDGIVAGVLSMITADAGVSDREVLRDIAFQLNQPMALPNGQPSHAMTRAYLSALDGRPWPALRIDFLRRSTGKREVRCMLFDLNNRAPAHDDSTDVVPRFSMLINLKSLADKFVHAERRRKAN